MGFWKEFFAAPMKADSIKSNEISAEVIHAEVDEAEEKFLNKVKEILSQKEATATKVVVEDHVKNKANMLKELGFSNNSLITDVKKRETLKESLQKEAKLLEETIDLFQKYKAHYPTEKIMPFEDFHKVLVKYNLIYAPASTYVRDVPEKNLLEIKNSTPTRYEDKCPPVMFLSKIECRKGWRSAEITDKQKKNFLKEIKDKNLNIHNTKYIKKSSYNARIYSNLEDRWCTTTEETDWLINYCYSRLVKLCSKSEKFKHMFKFSNNSTYIVLDINVCRDLLTKPSEINFGLDKHDLLRFLPWLDNLIKRGYQGVYVYIDEYNSVEEKGKDFNIIIDKIENIVKHHTEKDVDVDITFESIDRTGLLIAAPKSHFDMSSLTKVEDRGYYTQNIEEIKVNVVTTDPIAFELLAGNEQYPDGFVRIKSKWGTADDQSYLDPALTNENMN